MNLKTEINLFSHVGFVDKLLFTKHLAVMVKSGLPLTEAITTLQDQTKNSAFHAMVSSIGTDIENGQSLSKALSRFPKVFDSLYISLIEIGEQSGNLEINLDYLAGQLKKTYDLNRKIQSALMYPTLVLVAALLIGGSISIFVLPKLVDFFHSLDVKLPLSTRILLFIATTMRDFGVFIVLGVAGIFIGLSALTRSEKFKPTWHTFLISIPILGPFLQNVILASIFRNLGIMLTSGLPISATLRAGAAASPNVVYRGYIERLSASIDRGKSIESELTEGDYKHIPLIATRMIGVGERTGKLDESLLYLADFFEEEADNTAKNFSTILEPVILLFIAVIVAFLAISIMTPIYQLTGSIQK